MGRLRAVPVPAEACSLDDVLMVSGLGGEMMRGSLGATGARSILPPFRAFVGFGPARLQRLLDLILVPLELGCRAGSFGRATGNDDAAGEHGHDHGDGEASQTFRDQNPSTHGLLWED